MWCRTLTCLLGIAVPATSLVAQGKCPVRGVWFLESVVVDGTPVPMGQRRQTKIVTAGHYAWTRQAPGPATLSSRADTLAAFRTAGFGGGTYRVTDSTYTEKLEYFYNPEYVGREITFSCRVVGDRWYHSGDRPVIQGGRQVRRGRLEEVWRRVE